MSKFQLNEEIKEYCRLLRLSQIPAQYEELSKTTDSYEHFLRDLLYAETEALANKSVESRIRRAHFPFRKYLEDIDTKCLPIGMQRMLPQLASLDFIREGKNLILTGNPGTGKTHTAIGLGIRACEAGFSVLFTTVPLLITELKESSSQNKLRAFERRFERYDLVIADELGYAAFDRAGVDLLFTNLSLRAVSKSTIITSNLTFERWNEVFGDPAITSAIVDRLTYKAILVDMKGDSYRLRETLRENGLTYEALGGKKNEI